MFGMRTLCFIYEQCLWYASSSTLQILCTVIYFIALMGLKVVRCIHKMSSDSSIALWLGVRYVKTWGHCVKLNYEIIMLKNITLS